MNLFIFQEEKSLGAPVWEMARAHGESVVFYGHGSWITWEPAGSNYPAECETARRCFVHACAGGAAEYAMYRPESQADLTCLNVLARLQGDLAMILPRQLPSDAIGELAQIKWQAGTPVARLISLQLLPELQPDWMCFLCWVRNYWHYNVLACKSVSTVSDVLRFARPGSGFKAISLDDVLSIERDNFARIYEHMVLGIEASVLSSAHQAAAQRWCTALESLLHEWEGRCRG